MYNILILAVFYAIIFLFIGYIWGNTVGYATGSKEERKRWSGTFRNIQKNFMLTLAEMKKTDKQVKGHDTRGNNFKG